MRKRRVLLVTLSSLMVAVGGAAFRAAASGDGAKAPAPAKLNPDLVDLPPNTWVKITPHRNPVGRSYSGICWGNGMLFYFGGGHQSHPCNDVELYDVASNTWTRATEPEDFRDADKGSWTHLAPELVDLAKKSGGMTKHVANNGNHYLVQSGKYLNILSPKGRPLVAHTYQQHVWWPEEPAFYQIHTNWNAMWAFDPAKKEWRLESQPLPPQGDLSTSALAYDPRLKTIFAIITSRNSGVQIFDRTTRTWTKKCDLPADSYGEVHTAYDSARKVHVVRTTRPQGRNWHDLDLPTGRFRPIKPPDEVMKAAGKFPTSGQLQEQSIAYDPDSRQTLLIGQVKYNSRSPVDLWAYDAEKDQWSAVKMNGTPPTGFAQWGLLAYDPDHKCCLFLNVLSVGGGFRGGQVDGVFAFRLKKE